MNQEELDQKCRRGRIHDGQLHWMLADAVASHKGGVHMNRTSSDAHEDTFRITTQIDAVICIRKPLVADAHEDTFRIKKDSNFII